MNSKNYKNKNIQKINVFSHINHIRNVQDPQYYINLSEENKKSFNAFIIIRGLSMDESLVETMSQLYRIYLYIPLPQLYTLLIALVPKSDRFYPWVKSKRMRHKKEFLNIVSNTFKVSNRQAEDYINILIRTEDGRIELENICRDFGLDDKEIEKTFNNGTDKNYEKNIK